MTECTTLHRGGSKADDVAHAKQQDPDSLARRRRRESAGKGNRAMRRANWDRTGAMPSNNSNTRSPLHKKEEWVVWI